MRRLLFLGLIAGAFSIPAILPDTESSRQEETPIDPWALPVNPASPATLPPVVVPPESGSNGSPFQLASSNGPGSPMVQAQPPVYHAFVNPGEYLNFRITPEWIRTRFPRVSVSAGEDELTGLRVPFVSGPRPVDIHGSLTWYFDGGGKLQRITFRGWTGNPGELEEMLTRQFRFSPVRSEATRMWETSSWGKLKGFLRLDYPPVLRKDAPTEQLMVLLEIVNPDSSLAVSEHNRRILEAMPR